MAYNPATDSLTNSFETMNIAHNKIHEGKLFGGVSALNVGAGATVPLVLDIPAGINAHIFFSFLVDARLRIIIYDDPTNITRFAQVQTFGVNRNRNSPKNPPTGFETWVLNAMPGPGTLFYDMTINPGTWIAVCREEEEIIFGSGDGTARSHVVTLTAPGGAVAGTLCSLAYFLPY